ncbi:hypothetical protein RJ640_030041 [Escallonia rubra]|uniref:F-box domain-containing protein n=1 Tax=Escallonia rubra TaxID=112253 RepID=A0AA88URR4_9ASTE|nr:hypothetical protein RJ640_030041 [Escallonia rubra]
MEEDHINRLPDALLLSIFETLSDAKCLFRCSLVSKRFAPLVFQTRTVSLQIPAWTPYIRNEICKLDAPLTNFQKLLVFFKNPLRHIRNLRITREERLLRSVSQYRKKSVAWVVDVLQNFVCIESLHLQLCPSARFHRGDSFIHWNGEKINLLSKSLGIIGKAQWIEASTGVKRVDHLAKWSTCNTVALNSTHQDNLTSPNG